MAFLFDTDAVSELFRPRPLSMYLGWLESVPREDQYASAVTVGELHYGAFRSQARARHEKNIEERLLPAVTILPYDAATARVLGRIRANLEKEGQRLPDGDLQIAATALYHNLDLVTGNLRHFERIPGLRLSRVLEEARSSDR